MANRASFPIDCNSEVLQDGAGMYSGRDVTAHYRVMNSSVRTVKWSIGRYYMHCQPLNLLIATFL